VNIFCLPPPASLSLSLSLFFHRVSHRDDLRAAPPRPLILRKSRRATPSLPPSLAPLLLLLPSPPDVGGKARQEATAGNTRAGMRAERMRGLMAFPRNRSLIMRSIKRRSTRATKRARVRALFRTHPTTTTTTTTMHGCDYASDRCAIADSGFPIPRILFVGRVSRSPLILCLTRQSALRGNAFNYKRKRATVLRAASLSVSLSLSLSLSRRRRRRRDAAVQ